MASTAAPGQQFFASPLNDGPFKQMYSGSDLGPAPSTSTAAAFTSSFFPSSLLDDSAPAPGPMPASSHNASTSGVIGSAHSHSVTSVSAPVGLRVHNLPRDLSPREFRVLFTFADGFLYSELQKSQSITDDGLPTSVLGTAYFRTYQAATAALTILDNRSDVFFAAGSPSQAPAQVSTATSGSTAAASSANSTTGASSTPASTSSSSSPTIAFNLNSASTLPLKCDIASGRQQSVSHESLARLSMSAGKGPSGSRFAFAQPSATTPLEMPPPFSEYYSESGGGLFSPTSPRTLFPISQPPPPPLSSISPPGPPGVQQAPPASQPPQTQSAPETPAKDANGGVPILNGRASGRSLLLESQGREDEEFNSIVQDPARFFARDPSFMGFPPPTGSSGIHGAVAPTGTAAPNGQQPSQTSQPQPQQVSPPLIHQQSFEGRIPMNGLGSAIGNGIGSGLKSGPAPGGQWADKRRQSSSTATRQMASLSISGPAAAPTSTPAPANGADPSKVVVAYSPTNSTQAIQIMQNGGRVMPPANPADQNPPCNTLYVGNLPPDTSEEELKDLFSTRRGYKRLCFRTKANGPMCFVEFEDVNYATRALEELYGFGLSNSVKGGIRLSFSKNPLGVRGSNSGSSSGPSNGNGNGNRIPPGLSNGGAKTGSSVGYRYTNGQQNFNGNY